MLATMKNEYNKLSDIERFIIFIFLLCYYYTGHDEKTKDI